MATEEQLLYDSDQYISDTYGDKQCQRLTISNRYITKLAFYIKRVGTDNYEIYFGIWRVSDGSLITRSDTFYGSSLTTSYQLVEKDLQTPNVVVNEEVRMGVCQSAAIGTTSITRIAYQSTDVKADEYRSKHNYLADWVDY
jgi:hypothetical protein